MTVTVLAEPLGSMLAPLVGVEPGFPSPDSADTRVTWKDSASSGRLSSKTNRFSTSEIKEQIHIFLNVNNTLKIICKQRNLD